jgi:Family of unknown function (DUF6232)
MSEQMIMKSPGVEITTKIAKFGSISYQVANIGSVSVYTARKINPIAAVLVIVGIAAGFYANNLKGQGQDASLLFWIAAALVFGGILLQMFWPKKEFTFVLKTSSNDVHKIVSENGGYLESLQGAIETAFVERT